MRTALLLALTLVFTACGEETDTESPLFTLVPAEESGVAFANTLQETADLNILAFPHLYNGGGVAVGDVDGDGLHDLYFTGTQVDDRLYRNEGDFQFVDVTGQSGLGRDLPGTSRGVTMADVNGDGHLDIYVARGGTQEGQRVPNRLYVNDGAGRFTEQAAAFGLADEGYSIQSTFFDYDRDGDLDLFLINAPIRFEDPSRLTGGELHRAVDAYTSDRFYRNDGGRFTDVTAEVGMESYAFGLSATVLDYDRDGWLDLYLANDFVVPDFLYRNLGDGTFEEITPEALAHTSFFSMGSDVADVNNDGYDDLVVLDMNAEDNRRQKLLATGMMYDGHLLRLAQGYRQQVMRNMLHLNNGDGTFSEVGQLAGISNTDWSWGPLLGDFDLDGWQDVYIANGYRRDVTNLDYMQFTVDSLRRAGATMARIEDFLELVPTEKLRNYAYRNLGGLTFENVSSAWGLDDATYSNGAMHADLDGDGDLDLIVNDLDGPARLYRNAASDRFPERGWLTVRLEGPEGNPFGVGARVEVQHGETIHAATLITTRGFYSSAPPELHVGLGDTTAVSVYVQWPDGRVQTIDDVAPGRRMMLHYADATDGAPREERLAAPLFTEAAESGLAFTHEEDAYDDFREHGLLPHKLSREGPALAVGDVDGDGLDDVFVGGAAGQAGALFRQTAAGRFVRDTAADALFGRDAAQEDVRALFADIDGDGHLDLYVGVGGSQLAAPADGLAGEAGAIYQDQLYRGDGAGGFTAAPDGTLPAMPTPTGAVAAGDADGDGDLDLFIGGRLVPGRYPESPRSYLLLNEQGRFEDATARLAPDLQRPGLVTGAVWADLDGDGSLELALAGEWMGVTVWGRTPDGTLAERAGAGLASQTGWWNGLWSADLDGDGDTDLLGGNLGRNTRLHASADEPLQVFARDFDNNGSYEPVLAQYYVDGGPFPLARREVLTAQLPYLKQRYPRYTRFSSSTVQDIFSDDELEGALRRQAVTLESAWFENDGTGRFTAHPLPVAAQVAPVYAAAFLDLNGDGRLDGVLGGNNRSAEVEQGPYDALRGAVLLGQPGPPGWSIQPTRRTGLALRGDVRGMAWITTPEGPALVVVNNDGPVQVYRPNRTGPPA